MTKPPPLTFLFGNWATLLVAWGLGVVFLLQWWLGMVSGLVPFIALVMMAGTGGARQQLTRYRRWKRAWDAIGGVAPRRVPWVLLTAVSAWVLAGLGVIGLDHSKPESTDITIGFVVVSLLLFIGIAYLDHRHKTRGRVRPSKVTVVSICLPVPRRSPGPRQFFSDLPPLPGGARR